MKIYALHATIEEIIEHYEVEKNQESARTIEAIQKLKELSSAGSSLYCVGSRVNLYTNSR